VNAPRNAEFHSMRGTPSIRQLYWRVTPHRVPPCLCPCAAAPQRVSCFIPTCIGCSSGVANIASFGPGVGITGGSPNIPRNLSQMISPSARVISTLMRVRYYSWMSRTKVFGSTDCEIFMCLLIPPPPRCPGDGPLCVTSQANVCNRPALVVSWREL